MNKSQLVEALAEKTQQSKSEAEKSLDAFTRIVSNNIQKEEGIRLAGFGTFTVVERRARMGRNPKTGEMIEIPARRVPVFKPGKELKQQVLASHSS